MNFDEVKQRIEEGFSPCDCELKLLKDGVISFVVYDNRKNATYRNEKINITNLTEEQLQRGN